MTISGAAWSLVAPSVLVSLPIAGASPVGPGPVLPVVVSLWIVGVSISDWFGGDDDDDEGDDKSIEEAIDSAFEEAVGGGQGSTDPDDLGDLDDLAEDGDEWDDFGGLDGEGVDGMDDEDGVDPSSLESRVDELENEIASVSSTMSTVRSENEEISETVGEVEENVRKLLDIYEVVTQGVNPFVDEVQQGGESGGFGLFDGAEGSTGEEGTPDDDIMSEDAEAFFDDDFDEGFDEGLDADPGGFEFGDADGADRDGDADPESGDDGGGMTFEELKAEYESGDADRADDPGRGESDDGIPDGDEPDGNEVVVGSAADSDASADVGVDTGDPRNAAGDAVEEDAAGATDADAPSDGPGDKPYLASLPDGYGAELLVMEWLDYLLGSSNVAETLQAIRYYRSVEWISDGVADDLRTILGGFERGREVGPARTDGSGLSQLTIEHHETSLRYISRLTGGEFRRRSFEMGGGDRGL